MFCDALCDNKLIVIDKNKTSKGKLIYIGRFNKKGYEYSNSESSSLIKISPRIINKENPKNKIVGPFWTAKHKYIPRINVKVEM